MSRVVMAKHCYDCGELKPLTAFQRDTHGAMQRRSDCRQCRKRRHWGESNITYGLDPLTDLLWYATPWQN